VSGDSRFIPSLAERLKGTGVRWVTAIHLFGQKDPRNIYTTYFSGTCVYGVSERGGYVVGSKLNGMFGYDRYSGDPMSDKGMLAYAPRDVELDNESVSILTYQSFIPMLAMMTLHCRKAIMVDGGIKPPHEQKGRTKQGKLPLVQYKTLTIEPFKKILKAVTGSDHLSAKALHLCRAHWKVYDDGNGLFGKYKGTYFWSAFERGNIEFGRVVKDYKIEAPPKGDFHE
jgi:hypothetical protein